jgi:PhnB protein
MANDPIPTTLAPFLSVRNAAKAVEFYKSAFAAEELFRHEDPAGAVVSNLAINGYGFWVADESPEHKNFSPETLNGGTVRMILTTEDPEAAFYRAIAAGATVVCPIRTEHAWRIGRVLDPFGHHWEIGKPLQET